jgi:RNA polymerase sigma factor (sigma-70 family)
LETVRRRKVNREAGVAAPAPLEALFREHQGWLRRYVRRRLGAQLRRRVDSEDVLHEALCEAVQLFPAAKKGRSMAGREFLAWMGTLIDFRIKNLYRHHVRALRRSVGREVELDGRTNGALVAGNGKTPSAELLLKEQRDRIEAAIRRLSRREREVIDLVHFQGLRVAEAAGRMGKTALATAVLLCNARKRLRGLLKGEDRE